ncbi:glycosyltransferase family 4 protein [Citricoccus muralis]|uniref:Uncharacterized protein n=1 Tax=Citricoccus muralis TaxID=169134 RepID=A0A3D9LAR4_9MICC|nr:glycosyltransferase family 4 protein [Citricoccus muralis]REE02756.1 hypothetical protein C8E99_0539 [Citricoccus muralis]
MRVVLYDGIQETHVASSLERALRSRGHEVYNTGRFGSGYLFRDTDELLPSIASHLDLITDFRPDLVLVFRPASAPYPVLQALRGTGAVVAAWLSDDPVLFKDSYGPVIDLYDLILHCGNESVLRFYEQRFGRPTGVNFPFWTDHAAFPAVYGRHEPESTVMFLGNMVGPVRRARYEQLAAMGHSVRVYGRMEADPAGMGGGFLDSDAEVAEAGGRARVALNIPQFFSAYRGQPTWFPGLEDLGHFDLPSRVVQYAAMGLPVVSVVPGSPRSPAFPEMEVCGSIEEADRWITDMLDSGGLSALAARTLDRFDHSFSAAARVQALEALLQDDSWRSLDAAERTVWFLQFDGRTVPDGSVAPVAPVTAEIRDAPDTRDTPLAAERAGDVLLAYRYPPRRFDATDVIRRELEDWGRLAAVWIPEDNDDDGLRSLLASLEGGPVRYLVLADGLRLSAREADAARDAGLSTVCLLSEETFSPSDAARYDLVVRIGPAPADRVNLLGPAKNALHTPAVVESAFLAAVQRRTAQPHDSSDAWTGLTVIRSDDGSEAGTGAGASADPVADSLGHVFTGPARDLTTRDLATRDVAAGDLKDAGPDELVGALSGTAVYLQPAGSGRQRSHAPVTPYAVCAGPMVLTSRHPANRFDDVWSDWLLKIGSAEEAALKLDRLSGASRVAGVAESSKVADAEGRGRLLDARRQLDDWFRRADAHRAIGRVNGSADLGVLGNPGSPGDPADLPSPLTAGADRMVLLDHRYPVEPAAFEWAAGEYVALGLSYTGADLVRGMRVLQGDRVLAETRFPAGSTQAVDLIATGAPDPAREPVSVELLGDPAHRLHRMTRVRLRMGVHRGTWLASATSAPGLAIHLLPRPVSPAGPPRLQHHPGPPERRHP